MKYFLLLVFPLLVGCIGESRAETDYSALIHVSSALASTQTIDDKPVDTTHNRKDCPTGGWVTHGDGHRTRCADCKPPWDSTEQPKQILPPKSDYPPGRKCSPYCRCKDNPCPCDNQAECFKYNNLKWNTNNGKCCSDCVCRDCTCMYTGQCLVEKNNSRDYTTYEYRRDCSTGSCRPVEVPVKTYKYQSPEEVLYRLKTYKPTPKVENYRYVPNYQPYTRRRGLFR